MNKTHITSENVKDEFLNVRRWRVTEKIDGTNIRIYYNRIDNGPNEIMFKGRTDKAQIPPHLLDALNETFTEKRLSQLLEDNETSSIILYGEGYGSKIQKHGNLYREDCSFILFDVWIDGWWLDKDKIESVAEQLKIKLVPEIGIMEIDDIVAYVEDRHSSFEAKERLRMEGIVARSYPLMLFRDGKPIMWKLKCEDYDKLERFSNGV